MSLRANMPVTRRRPWPYDLYLGTVRCLLEPDKDGNLVSENSRTLDETAPIDYTYSSANPYKERTSEWQKLYGGFGQTVADEADVSRRYWYAEKSDLSVDGLWMKGPAFEQHVETIAVGAGEVRQLVQAMHGGALTVFAICENGIYRRVADNNWVASLTAATAPALPGGVHPQQAVRFTHRGASPLDALYVAMSSGNLWRYNGAAWSKAADAAGPPDDGTGVGVARYIERNNDELWVASDYGVAKVEDDPFTRANWAAIIEVGDRTAKTTWLRTLDGVFVTYKEDGIYTVDNTGISHELFTTLRGKNNYYNGKNATVWLDRMWFTYGNQTFTMNSSAALKPDGLEQMLENTSTVKGRWIGGAGHNTWFFYEVYYNEQIDTSYLVKHGTWVEEASEQSVPGVAEFAEAHHGSLFDWDKRATVVEILSGVAASGNDRLYVGFLDGTITWTPLPMHSPNPAEDVNCEFTTLDSYVYLPQHHSRFQADNKLWHAVTGLGPRLSPSEWIEVSYKTDVSNPFASWTLVSPDDPKYTLPGMRKNLTEDEVSNPVFGRSVLMRVKLCKDPDLGVSPLNQTPITNGIAIHESIRPAFSREFSFNVRVGSFLPKRDGTVDRRRGVTIQDDLLRVCATVGPVYVLLPTGVVESMTIIRYDDSSGSRQKFRDHTWSIEIRAIQLRTITEGAPQTQPPITVGLTYATLEQYTLGQLEGII